MGPDDGTSTCKSEDVRTHSSDADRSHKTTTSSNLNVQQEGIARISQTRRFFVGGYTPSHCVVECVKDIYNVTGNRQLIDT